MTAASFAPAVLSPAVVHAARRAGGRRWRSAPPRMPCARRRPRRRPGADEPASARRVRRPSGSPRTGFPACVAPTEDELRTLRNVEAAAQLYRRQGLRLRLPPGLEDDAAHARGAHGVRAVHGRARRAAADGRRRHRRQRAEPQPLLAPAVQRRRHERLGARVPLAAAPRPTTRSRPSTRRRGSGAARSRRAGRTGPKAAGRHSSPTAFLQALGGAYRASGRTTPDHGRPRASTRTPDNSSQTPTSHTRSRPRSASRTTASSCAARAGVRRHRAGRLLAADPLRRVRGRVDRPGREGVDLRRRRAGDDEARRRDHAGRVLPARLQIAFCQPTVAGILLFHYQDERDARRAGSRACTTRTERRRRASTPFATPSRRTRGGSIAHCDGLALDVVATQVQFPTKAGFKRGERTCGSGARSTASGCSARRARRRSRHRAAARLRARRRPADRLADGPQDRRPARQAHPHGRPPRQPRADRSAEPRALAALVPLEPPGAYDCRHERQASLRAHRGSRGRPVRRVHLLQGRPRLAPPPRRRAARRTRKRSRTSSRSGRADRGPSRLLRRSASDPRPTSFSGRSSRATAIFSRSAPRSTAPPSPAGSTPRTPTSPPPSRRSTPTRSGSARDVCSRERRRTSSCTRS